MVDAMNMVYMLLPGTPITYYGEEIGMTNGVLESSTDKRDPERTPMQWSSEAQAGQLHLLTCLFDLVNNLNYILQLLNVINQHFILKKQKNLIF